MAGLKIAETKLADWHNLIVEAQNMADQQLEESLECYLIMTLDAFIREHHLAGTTVALEFLHAIQLTDSECRKRMRHVGDHCLLISGLFPEHAERRNVSLAYYIGLGQHAYISIANSARGIRFDPELFAKLSHRFTDLTSVLHAMRSMPFQHLLMQKA